MLLLAPGTALVRASVPDGRLAGALVIVEVSERDRLPCILGSLLGGLSLDTARLEERLHARSGCAILRGTPWTETVFSALQPLQAEERGRYCAFKTAELLYLLSTDSPLLPLPPEAPGRERYQVELMRQVRDHMLAHLADPLTISQLAARFHISPTALKDCFRQAYGRPLHQYLLEHRVRRAAELLSESGLSIVEIASAVGYNSASQFGVAFKLDEICQFIKGPDFPTGGVIMGRSGIRAAYATGRGKIKVRAKTEIVDLPNGKSQIVITEIPYMVNKARLVESMANLVKDKRVEGITNIQDHSSREGMQIVVDVRRDANAQVILNQLFTYSQLEDTISMIHRSQLRCRRPSGCP